MPVSENAKAFSAAQRFHANADCHGDKPPNCIKRRAITAGASDFRERIVPATLPGANIFSIEDRLDAMEHWERRADGLRPRVAKLNEDDHALFKRMEKVIVEKDWEKFDGFTPTYTHPTLSEREMKFLLGAAYTRFYMRPSYLADLWRIRSESVRDWLGRWDGRVAARHTREERAQMSRPVTC